jgi:hypothetical protein
MMTLGKKIRKGMGNARRNIGKIGIYGLIGFGSMVMYNCGPGVPPSPETETPVVEMTEEERLAEQEATAQQNLALGTIGLAVAKTPEELAVASLLYIMGKSDHELAVARTGRDIIDVNIDNSGRDNYVEDQQPNLLRKKPQNYVDEFYYYLEKNGLISPPASFVCTEIEDRNGDGDIGDSEIDKGYYFKSPQDTLQLILGASWYNIQDKSIVMKVKNGDGKLQWGLDFGKMGRSSAITYIPAVFLGGANTNFGEYILEWDVDGVNYPSRTVRFTVEHNNKK